MTLAIGMIAGAFFVLGIVGAVKITVEYIQKRKGKKGDSSGV